MKLSRKVEGYDKYEELGSLEIPLRRMVADFKGKKGDLFTSISLNIQQNLKLEVIR
jgi:hypothetical protein